MKSRIIIAIAALFVFASFAQAQKTVVDVDKSFDFSKFKTFAWSDGQIAPKATTSEMLVAAIERELTMRGLVRNDTAPDIRIAVMAAAGMDLQGVGPTWNNERYRFWGGYGNPAALMTVTSGTLLIDLIETKNKYSIWRAVVKDVFVTPPTGDLEKDLKQMQGLVNKTIPKVFKKYPVRPKN
ncbi:MAG TPA: DUF4136 domain-containing protein [Pyrinomonadaceae bacterium]|nr:DUF4136 domain-containing protein [Pyrinomonadaceae bacterium]